MPCFASSPFIDVPTDTGCPAWSAAHRTLSIHRARSSGVPCDALMRMTLAPASSRPAMAASVPVAGPIVATILVRRIKTGLPWLAGYK